MTPQFVYQIEVRRYAPTEPWRPLPGYFDSQYAAMRQADMVTGWAHIRIARFARDVVILL